MEGFIQMEFLAEPFQDLLGKFRVQGVNLAGLSRGQVNNEKGYYGHEEEGNEFLNGASAEKGSHPSSLHIKSGNFGAFDPFVEVKRIISRLGRLDPAVPYRSIRIEILDDDAFVQNGGPLSDVEEVVGLLLGDNLMEAMAIGHLFVVIVLLSDLNDEIVRFLVPKSHEIELIGLGLA
jgi:hypothetical protein